LTGFNLNWILRKKMLEEGFKWNDRVLTLALGCFDKCDKDITANTIITGLKITPATPKPRVFIKRES
jgi:hypothetical protein